MVVRGGNQALNVNFPGTTIDYSGGTADIALTVHGSDWYWAVTAVMAASTFTFMGLSHSKPREQRIFHYLTAAITMVASIAYFSMASGLGWAPIDVEFKRNKAVVAGNAREIFYVRYIDWFITTPLLLMDLLLTAAIPWPTIVFTIMMDWVMIITGLAGALLYSSYKWGYFSFGCAALFYIAYVLTWEARKNAQLVGSDVGKVYLMCGSWTIFLWFLYPIAWGLCEGGNVISPDSEAIFYGILDICAKPLFGALLLYGHRNIDIERLGMNIRRYGVPFAGVPQKGNKERNGGENDYGVPVNGTDAARTVTNGESAA